MKDQKNTVKLKVERDWFLPILVFLIGLVVVGTLRYHFKKNQESLVQSKAELNATTYAEHMRLDLMQGINTTITLKQILTSNDGQIRKFPEIAESMMTDFIQSIQLAPGGVVTDIYPEQGNEAGKIDLLNDKDRGEISRYGRDNNVITMQGPFNLKQGGSGIAVRNPVFLENKNGKQEFWGFTIVIIRVPEIFSESVKALSNFGYDYQLFKSKSPWDETYIGVYGSETQMEHAVTYEFEVGDTKWLLEVQPKGGWSSNQNYHLMIACGLLISLLIAGLVAVITLLKRTKETERQTEKLNCRLQETLDLANAGSVAKTKFINNMSHDIRTPMNAIMGYTAIALKLDPEEKTRECLEKINKSSEQLLTLINDVLDISRIESGKLKITPVRTDIRTIVDDVLSITQGFTVGRELKVIVQRNKLDTPYVLADPIRIREVLVNVLSNAVKFTKDGGTITFGADYEKAADGKKITVKYVISDTGIGMSEDFQRHIFDEFAQENSDARTQYKGTGLGMSIVKQYVDLMQGTILVQSKKNEGTTVTIKIPLELTEEVPTTEKVIPKDLSGLRCLLVEDNDLNAEIAQILLEDQGITVTRVSDGKQAVEIFEKKPADTFDLILMDIMMPVMNGLEATKAIRSCSRPDSKTIPIIAMTANAFQEDAKKCLEAGMNAHLAKPLQIEKVVETIAKIMPFKHKTL